MAGKPKIMQLVPGVWVKKAGPRILSAVGAAVFAAAVLKQANFV